MSHRESLVTAKNGALFLIVAWLTPLTPTILKLQKMNLKT